MANPHKGEVDLVAGETTYTLRLSINEIVSLETLLDSDVTSISLMLSSEKPRLGVWRAALWAALQCHHRGMSLEDAGEVIAIAGLPTVMGKVGEALQAAFPAVEAADDARPQKAGRGGTGKA